MKRREFLKKVAVLPVIVVAPDVLGRILPDAVVPLDSLGPEITTGNLFDNCQSFTISGLTDKDTVTQIFPDGSKQIKQPDKGHSTVTFRNNRT